MLLAESPDENKNLIPPHLEIGKLQKMNTLFLDLDAL